MLGDHVNSAIISATIFCIGAIANAAITYAAVSRHEGLLKELDKKVDGLTTDVAVLKATSKI